MKTSDRYAPIIQEHAASFQLRYLLKLILLSFRALLKHSTCHNRVSIKPLSLGTFLWISESLLSPSPRNPPLVTPEAKKRVFEILAKYTEIKKDIFIRIICEIFRKFVL